jgi:hypothetical protein
VLRVNNAPNLGSTGPVGALLYAAGTSDRGFLSFEIPPDMATGATLWLRAYAFSTTGQTNTPKAARFKIEFHTYDSGMDYDARTLETFATLVTYPASARVFKIGQIAIPWSGPSNPNNPLSRKLITLKLLRDGANAADTLGGAWAVTEFCAEYMADKLGE